MPCILALDQGTSGTTALVVRDDGRIIGRGYREVAAQYPRPGWVEQDAEEIFRATIDAGAAALSAAGERPAGIGIANQRETVVLWERATLAPVSPAIVWQDRRTSDRCRQLVADGHQQLIRDRTGLVPDPYFSATKLEWLLRDPGLRWRAETGELAAGTIDTWLIARLTDGRAHLTDHTNASRTMLYSLAARDWDDELLELFSIPRLLLPAVVPSSAVVAETDARCFGTPLPIAGMAGDQQASLFGHGCVREGDAKNTYGTGAFLLRHAGASRPPACEGLLTTIACGPGGQPEYALEGSVLVAGAAIQWLRDGLGILGDAAASEADARAVPDTGGVTFVPAFAGLGTPYWEPDARGTITGISRGTTRAHLVRAALEAMAFGSAELLAAMATAGSEDSSPLRVDGGAAANDWLMQFQADIIDRPVERPDSVETTALGAAALAGIALGVWPNLAAFRGPATARRFVPAMDRGERERRLKEWRRAVGAALSWARS